MTLAELKEHYPHTHFIKTKSYIEEPDVALMKKEFIPDSETKEFPDLIRGSKCYPLSITSYPRVLKRMSALQAGAWAITKCMKENWQIDKDNIECCLANLEMDFQLHE